MENTTKYTKRAFYEAVISIMNGASSIEIPADEMIRIANGELEALDKKAAAAKARAAKKKEDNCELREKVFSTLSAFDGPLTMTTLMKEMNFSTEVPTQAIVPQLTDLVKSGRVEKGSVTVKDEDGKSHKVTTYRAIV